MSLLPLLFLLLFSQNNQNFQLKNILENLDVQSLAPVLNLLGINGNAINLLSSPQFKEILNGNANLTSILPSLLPLFSGLFNAENSSDKKNDGAKAPPKDQCFYLSPIEDFANDTVKNGLSDYFAQL